MLRIGVLGSLEATHGPVDPAGSPAHPSGTRSAAVDLGGPRQRAVLSLLLVARGHVVSVDRLIDDLWHAEPPPRAIGALQAYVSHLRRGLEPDRAPRTPASILVSEPPGYAIRLPVEAVDAWWFDALVRRSATQHDPHGARDTLEQALGLWRGQAYAEVAEEEWATAECARLEGLRLVARERLGAALLACGATAEAASEAQALTLAHPMREEGWRVLALSLAAGGRQADALAAIRSARAILADELGLDPGPGLVRAEADILAGNVPRAPMSTTVAPAPGDVAPGPAVGDRSTTDARDGGAPAPVTDAVGAVGEARALPHDRELIGRDAELNALHAAAAPPTVGHRGSRRWAPVAERSAFRPGPGMRLALVAGEPGAGKTALLDRFARDLQDQGWRVCVGRCPEVDGAPPGWAWVEVLRSLTTEVDPGPRAQVLRPLLDDAVLGASTADASFGRFLLQRAVIDYLTEVAGERPLAIVLDDLHRGDAETVGLLAGVAGGLAATAAPAILLAGAYRPAEITPALQDALADLARHDPVRVALAGLDADQASRLIRLVSGVHADPQTLATLTARTGGNPFYLRESARLLGSEGGLVATSKVPEGVRDVLRRRFARLPEVTVSVLRLASVVGREVDIEVLLRAAEIGEDAVLDALETGVVGGLLDEPGPDTVRFTHALVRDTLYEDVSRLRRGRWHARVADALSELRPGDLAGLAHHWDRAATPATARRAADAAVRAAEQAAGRFAHDAAAALYGQALAALDRVPVAAESDPDVVPERVALLARKSLAELAGGAGLGAIATRNEALRLARAANRIDLKIRVLTSWDLPTPWLTRVYGRVDEPVVADIEQALAVQDLPDDTRCRLLCALVAQTNGELSDRAARSADEAVRLARRGSDAALLGLALHARTSVVLPESEESITLAAELTAIGQAPGLAVCALVGHYRTLQHAAAIWDLDQVRTALTEVQALSERFGWRQARATLIFTTALLAHAQGDLATAERLYGSAIGELRRFGAADTEPLYALTLATLRITEGRLGELQPMLRAVYEALPEEAADLYAMCLVGAGDRAEADRVRRTGGELGSDFFRSLFLTVRAMAVTEFGDVAAAREVYDRLFEHRGQLAGGGTGSFTIGPVDTRLGHLAALLGRPADAARHYAAALDLATRCGNPFWRSDARAALDGVRRR